jgi:hypothetical protein
MSRGKVKAQSNPGCEAIRQGDVEPVQISIKFLQRGTGSAKREEELTRKEHRLFHASEVERSHWHKQDKFQK